LLTGNENIKLQGDGIDAAIYFDADQPKHLKCESLFSETIIPVCTPEYADKLNLRESVEQLRHATLLHDNQAWDYDSNEDEWKVWAHANDLEGVEQYSRMSFDRSDLAVLAAQHGVGVAMGRTSLIEPLLLSGELITPFPNTEVTCKQHYYVATAPERKSDKVNLFVDWLKGVVG
jgi:LysR family D-serine deaminase transcriptional activator